VKLVLRVGLCCAFLDHPIRFRNTTVTAIQRMSRDTAREKLSALCLANAIELIRALECCQQLGIGCFRINSQILPLKTHREVGYQVDDLPDAPAIRAAFAAARKFAEDHRLRMAFHPDQFVVLNSLRDDVVDASIRELEYQAEVAEWIGADVINIHGGGAFGDKSAALDRFSRRLDRLSPRVRSRLTVENDDGIFTPADLLPLCHTTGIPLVYDVHHHRCHSDGQSIEAVTSAAIATWNREPLFHISSPAEGWDGPQPEKHHEMISVSDFPEAWRPLDITIEVEARAKEAAVLDLMQALVKKPKPKRR
jgi:UV DNA damage endonuclease